MRSSKRHGLQRISTWSYNRIYKNYLFFEGGGGVCVCVCKSFSRSPIKGNLQKVSFEKKPVNKYSVETSPSPDL